MKKTHLRALKIVITIILLSFIFDACTATKSSVTTKTDIERIKDSLRMVSIIRKSDTVTKTVYKTIIQPIHSVLEIPIECDENGKVKEVSYKTGNKNNYSNTTIKNNKLIIDYKTDSIVNSKEQIYKSFYSTKIDSLSRVIDALKESTSHTVTVKKEGWLFAHLKCTIIIISLLLVLGLVIRYK